ncbi:MAG: M48 family metallopeptidase [Pyrinomonadaceae bacterium]
MALKEDLKTFPDLSYHAFQHPLDSQAIAALQKVPGLPKVVKFISQHSIERTILIEKISSNLRVNAEQYPSLYRQYLKMAEILDVKKLPHLYIETTNTINAYAMGMENYTIVLCSGLIDIMDEDEMMAILGHELGHVKCEHMLYKTLTYMITNFGNELIKQVMPVVGNFLSLGLQLAILDWNRKAEFSCDRAALLATQDVDFVSRALGKLAGFSKRYGEEFNVDEVEVQAQDYHELGADSMITKALKLYSMIQQTHPYPVVRVKEIREWEKSAEYENIMSGNYARGIRTLAAADRTAYTVSTPRAKQCPNPKCLMLCPDNHNFCSNCQTNLREGKLVCSNCRQEVEEHWVVCASCGNPFREIRGDLPEAK